MRSPKTVSIVTVWLVLLVGLSQPGWSQTLSEYDARGMQQYNQADLTGALQTWEQGLEFAKQLENWAGVGSFHSRLAFVYQELNQLQKARSSYEHALKIFRDLGARYEEGRTLAGLANMLWKEESPKALLTYQQALQIMREIGDREGEGTVLGEIGVVHRNAGDYPQALATYEQALQIHEALNNRQMEGLTLNNMGFLHMHLGDYPKALNLCEHALAILREMGDRRGEAKVLTSLGIVYRNVGEYPAALTAYQEALRIQTDLKQHKQQGHILNNIGVVYGYLGNYARTLASYEQALQIAKTVGDRRAERSSLNNLGVEYLQLGDHRHALSLFEELLEARRRIHDRQGEGNALYNIGSVHVGRGDYSQALPYLEQARNIYKAVGLSPKVTMVETQIGSIYLDQGRVQDAFTIFRRLGAPIQLGRYYLKLGDYSKAQQEFTKSLKVDEQQKTAAFLLADYIGLGLAREGLKDYTGAKAAYQKAVQLIEQQREGLSQSQRRKFFAGKVQGFSRLEPYEGLVRVSAYLQETAESFLWAEHTKARALLEAVAQRSVGNLFGISETHARQETALINRIAATVKQQEVAFEQSNTGRYQVLEKELAKLRKERAAFVSRLRQDYPAYAAVHYPEPIGVSALSLEPDELLVEYEITDQQTLAWLIKGDKVIKTVSIPVTRTALNEKVRQYRRFFEGITHYSDLARFDPRMGKELYDLLLKDIVPYLNEGQKLIIVPDETLGILPFEALVVELPVKGKTLTGQYGAYPDGVIYLGDTCPVSYYQSATALHLARALKRAKGKEKMLVIADPIFASTDTRLNGSRTVLVQRDQDQLDVMRSVEEWNGEGSYPRLELTGQLADRFQLMYGSTVEILQGLTASENALRQRPLGQYRYIVFATHGILDKDVPYIQEPALVLSQIEVDPNESSRDGFLTMSEVMGLKLHAEIAVLTACNTGVGKNVTGEGVMGLGRAFQYAGAQTVLMSLWSVQEESTTLLSEQFFAALRQGKRKHEALQHARTAVRQAGYEHPFFWSPFVLVGEP